MNKEDQKFQDFLKTRLEEGVTLPQQTLAALQSVALEEARRRAISSKTRLPFPAICAIAAGLVLLCGLGVTFLRTPTRPTPDQQILHTIALLEASEKTEESASTTSESGSQVDSESQDPVDRLLVWQDAPFEQVEEELSSTL